MVDEVVALGLDARVLLYEDAAMKRWIEVLFASLQIFGCEKVVWCGRFELVPLLLKMFKCSQTLILGVTCTPEVGMA
jgi:hypothetical protein